MSKNKNWFLHTYPSVNKSYGSFYLCVANPFPVLGFVFIHLWEERAPAMHCGKIKVQLYGAYKENCTFSKFEPKSIIWILL